MQKIRLALILGLPAILVVYSITMGTAALLAHLNDVGGALALRWVGTICAMAFAIDLVWLVLLLAIERWRDDEPDA